MSAAARLLLGTAPRLLRTSASVGVTRTSISSYLPIRSLATTSRVFNKPMYTVTYELGNGERHTVQVSL